MLKTARPVRPKGLFTSAERTVAIGGIFSVLAILAIVIFMLWQERRDAHESAVRAAGNLVRLIDADIVRDVHLYDLALRGAISTAAQPGMQRLPASVRRQFFFDRAVAAPANSRMLLLDAQGRVFADSLPQAGGTHGFTQASYFRIHQERSDQGLFISEPYRSTAEPQGWRIAFSRRMNTPEGGFAGVAMGEMRLDYFDSLFRSLRIGRGSSINLLRDDGTQILQYPGDPEDLTGRNFHDNPVFQRLLDEGEGNFVGASAVTHKRRLYTFARVRGLPFLLVVADPEEEVYASWSRTALLVGAATALLCLAVLAFVFLLVREFRLRRDAEEKLIELASTDALTGLANRRRLDERFRLEWKRSLRYQRPLSLLMIDVDHFKRINDLQGHSAGDEVLRRVAEILGRHLRRPADIGGRYGGEEFCVLLPETGAAGAATLAEAIRGGIQEACAKAGDGITVSIGAVTRIVGKDDDRMDMIAAADRALYAAKRQGRNRVVTADGSDDLALADELVAVGQA